MYLKSAPWSRPVLMRFSSNVNIHCLQIEAPAAWSNVFKALCNERTLKGLPSSPLRYLRFHLMTLPLKPFSATKVFSIACFNSAIAGVALRNLAFNCLPSLLVPCTILPILPSPAPYKKASLCSTEFVKLCPPFGCSMSP